MVKLLALAVLHKSKQESKEQPVFIALAEDLSSFGWFTRGAIQEHIRFGFRTVCQRTDFGLRQTVRMEKFDYVVHAHVRSDGLCGIAITDEEYPTQAVFGGISQMLSEILKASKQSVDRAKDAKHNVSASIELHPSKDSFETPTFLKSMLSRFQDPKEADKAHKIQQTIKDVKDVLQKNVVQLLERGETLDKLMEDTKDLSYTSKAFHDRAARMNYWCCRIY
eukprot:jgi/Bigna1/46811/estExt_Genewise1.C_70115